MGFADISIQEIAEDFNVHINEVLRLCDQMKISYKNSQTRLALEDAKAIMSHLLAQQLKSDSK
ncbi:translation initiation factor IF-2 [Okeania sp.]|uniref:translation initiation factor IF-2 n=1 Tax=Okeania sp. TaxID=3100323 RepID=UPI002B4B2A1A|nr:translation initiation factor IF-2 [Okeania sp.]MEB3339755.1 translation initiation factor IF-2 [Okeania sp.]